MYKNRVENDNFFNPHYFLFCTEFTFSFKSPAKFFAEIQHCVLWEGNSNYTSYFEFSRVGIEDSESLSGFSCSQLIKAVSNYSPILCIIHYTKRKFQFLLCCSLPYILYIPMSRSFLINGIMNKGWTLITICSQLPN